MNISDNALLSRAAALLILIFALGAFLLVSATAYLDFLAADADQLGRDEQLLQRYRALAREGSPDEPSAPRDEAALLFPQIPESQAVALLQESLKSAAAAAQVEVQGLQVLRTEALPGAARIGVRLRGSADITGLNRLLYTIESARPLLFPDNLQIQSRTLRSGAPSTPLEFQLDVSSFRMEPAA